MSLASIPDHAAYAALVDFYSAVKVEVVSEGNWRLFPPDHP